MRISDWSSDVCSSDLARSPVAALWGILLVVAFYFPQRFMVSYDIAALLHWREALLIVAMAWLLHMQLRASRVVLSTGERKLGRYDESRAVRRRPGKGRGGEPAAPAGASPAGHGATVSEGRRGGKEWL